MNGRARPGATRSSSDVTTLPPSSGSTGIRLNAPITGPAHQTAAAASVLPRLEGVERVDAHDEQHEQAER